MLIDPSNRLVADTLEADWNEKLCALAKARDERERARRDDQIVLDEAIRERLVTMTTDFKRLWADPATPNRERKRMLAHIIEDATLLKRSADGTTRIHIRFKGGKTETLETRNPKSSAQQVTTPPMIVALVDQLLDDHVYVEIADLLNARGLHPGGSARPPACGRESGARARRTGGSGTAYRPETRSNAVRSNADQDRRSIADDQTTRNPWLTAPQAGPAGASLDRINAKSWMVHATRWRQRSQPHPTIHGVAYAAWRW